MTRLQQSPGELETFEIEPSLPQRGTVIWLHGLGATNHDFDDVVPELDAPYLRFVFPEAPVRPVTINGGMPMPAWYDIVSFSDPPLRENEQHVREVAESIETLIAREAERGVPPERVVLAGFSQGAALALHVGIRHAKPLAGIITLSGYLVVPGGFDAERSSANATTPILVCHGSFDPIVPFSLGQAMFTRLRDAGYPSQFFDYPMAHSLCLPEVIQIRRWLEQRFARNPQSKTE